MIESIIAAIEDGQTDEAIKMLKRIAQNNRGHNKLGQPGVVVINHPEQADQRIIDAVGFYTNSYTNARAADNLRMATLLTGGDALKVIPDWFKKSVGTMGRDQFVQLMYHTMVELDLVGKGIDKIPLPYTEREGMLRERLLFHGLINSITDPLPEHVKDEPIHKFFPLGAE